MATNGDHLRMRDFPVTHDMNLSEIPRYFPDADVDEVLAKMRERRKEVRKEITADMVAAIQAAEYETSPIGRAGAKVEKWGFLAALAFIAFTWGKSGFTEAAWAVSFGCLTVTLYYGIKYLILRLVAYFGGRSTSEAAASGGSPPTTGNTA